MVKRNLFSPCFSSHTFTYFYHQILISWSLSPSPSSRSSVLFHTGSTLNQTLWVLLSPSHSHNMSPYQPLPVNPWLWVREGQQIAVIHPVLFLLSDQRTWSLDVHLSPRLNSTFHKRTTLQECIQQPPACAFCTAIPLLRWQKWFWFATTSWQAVNNSIKTYALKFPSLQMDLFTSCHNTHYLL